MAPNKQELRRKLLHAGGWHVVKRAAKMLPFGGTVVVFALVGHDIKKKGLVKGVINSGLDAVPFLGLAKNGVELFTGDFIADKDQSGRRNGK